MLAICHHIEFLILNQVLVHANLVDHVFLEEVLNQSSLRILLAKSALFWLTYVKLLLRADTRKEAFRCLRLLYLIKGSLAPYAPEIGIASANRD